MLISWRRELALALLALMPSAAAAYAPPDALAGLDKEPVEWTHEEALRHALAHPAPACPAQAKLQDRVRLNAYVRPDGTVADTIVIFGPPRLVQAAETAVLHWRFQPVVDDRGHPAKAIAQLMFWMDCRKRAVSR